MSLWEYKVISSGKGGFASPTLLEKFLNDLGKEEWEIVEFRTQPDNPLAFSGLARRTTLRDWTLEDAAAAAARTEADKLRAEFEAKFRSATSSSQATAAEGTEGAAVLAVDKGEGEDGLRRLRDTESDLDPDAPDDEPKDEWDKLTAGDELPNFFEAIRPHLRRNQRGPGMSVGVDFLAKKWDLSEDDIKAALVECGFVMPADEDAKAEYLEFEGDLYWVNLNRRGELWINTKEKPRPVFRTVKGLRVAPEPGEADDVQASGQNGAAQGGEPVSGQEEDAANGSDRSRDKKGGRGRGHEGPSEPLPKGPELLERIRPLMRRSRDGSGGSGSASFLSRALKVREPELIEAFKALGLVEPAQGESDPAPIEIGDGHWFLNRDQRGGLWINGRTKAESGPESAAADATPPADGSVENVPQESAASASEPPPLPLEGIFADIRPHLSETRTGAFACEAARLSELLGRSQADVVEALVAAGLVIPDKPREKPVFVERGGEIFWFNRNAKEELWVNAKASRFAKEDGAERKPRRPRSRKQEG